MPHCGSCSLRAIPLEAVRAVGRMEGMLVLIPDPERPKELSEARATVWAGRRAIAFGAWVAAGPVYVELRDGTVVQSVVHGPEQVAKRLATLDAGAR